MQRATRSISAAIIATLLTPAVAPRRALATSSGIFGYSGKQLGRICTDCHGGGKAPDVTISGPLQVATGSLSTFRITVKSNGGTNQRFAGFNVAASAGILDVVDAVTQGSRRWPQSGEISHSARKQNTNGQAFWDFTWQAPSQPGSVDIFGAGNSTNANGATTGDNATGIVISVDVVSGSPSPTPTVTRTATATGTATRTATATATATNTQTAAASATSTRTATATATSVPSTPTSTAAEAATETPTAAPPVAGDCDGDGQITVADVQRLAMMLSRCPACATGGVAASGCAAVEGDPQCVAADLDLDGCISAAEFTRVLAPP